MRSYRPFCKLRTIIIKKKGKIVVRGLVAHWSAEFKRLGSRRGIKIRAHFHGTVRHGDLFPGVIKQRDEFRCQHAHGLAAEVGPPHHSLPALRAVDLCLFNVGADLVRGAV